MDKLSAADIRDLVIGGLSALEAHRDEINTLNVFPVPDGDTGTNMFLTMQSVVTELNACDTESIACYVKAIKDGSLKGARGNSGVILSQIFRGICDVLLTLDEVTANDLAKALTRGSKVAYEAVMKPVEGTMLTVIKDMAKAARKAARSTEDVIVVVEEVVREGEASLARTPDLLDTLREAGVVDAGGKGVVVLASSGLSTLKGETPTKFVVEAGTSTEVTESEEIDLTYLYCTEFLLKSESLNLASFKKKISGLGDSTLVVGSDGIYRTHVHTNDPGKVLGIATISGELSQIKINNMREQSEERARSLGITEVAEGKILPIGIVAVAAGEGLKKILRSLGASAIVDGGQTMNPAAADIANKVDELRSPEVIILPNNKNIILTAGQAAHLTKKSIVVIPTKSIPEAFAALLAFNQDKDIRANEQLMKRVIGEIKTGEITHASRDSKTSTGNIKKGDIIGLYNGRITATGQSLTKTGFDLISSMVDEDSEVVTILIGEGASRKSIDDLVEKLKRKYSDLEIEVHEGGQPLYPIIVGVE